MVEKILCTLVRILEGVNSMRARQILAGDTLGTKRRRDEVGVGGKGFLKIAFLSSDRR